MAAALTDVAGSSQWFERGYVTYSNLAKQQELGVNAATLAAQGAVSAAAVVEMATGVREVAGLTPSAHCRAANRQRASATTTSAAWRW